MRFVTPELTISKLKHLQLYSVDTSPNGRAFLRENNSQRHLYSTALQGSWIQRSSALPSARARLPYNQVFSSGAAGVGEETDHQKGALQHAESTMLSY